MATGSIVDPQDAAISAGLVYVSDTEPGIRRRRAGKGFSYRGPDGAPCDRACYEAWLRRAS